MHHSVLAAVMLCICAATYPVSGSAAFDGEAPVAHRSGKPGCAPELLDISGPRNDYNLSFSADGRLSVFARSDADFAHSKIYVRYGKRSAPRLISFPDARWRDSDPWLTPDGGTLYFISDRPTPSRPNARDLNIWRSHQQGGSWSRPEYLGDGINSAADELGPEVHGDTLYFASGRSGGMGGLDIYQVRLAAGDPGTPEPMPSPINSSQTESDLTLSLDGRTAVFWRLVDGRALLHRSQRQAGVWTEPKALPANINLGDVQFTPALTPSGTLIFASTAVRQGQPAGMADLYHVDFNCRSGGGNGESP